MELFGHILTVVWNLFNREFVIFGYTISFANVFIFVILSCLAGLIFRGFFGGSEK